MNTNKARLTCLLAAVLAMTSVVSADLISIEKDYNLYGHLCNTDDGTQSGNPRPWCAPTATVNSFVYLENAYPEIYDNLLTPGTDLAAREALRALMGGCAEGATAQEWWEGKFNYIQLNAPGTTIFDGMTWVDPAGWDGGWFLTHDFPTWDFLWEQLAKCEDVEIGIYMEEGGHALTLTSLHLWDDNDNGTWDPGEQAGIDYLDPNNPTQTFDAELSLGASGEIVFTWNNGGANPPEVAWIGLAYSESPVPEPASLVLLAVGGLWLLRRRRA